MAEPTTFAPSPTPPRPRQPWPRADPRCPQYRRRLQGRGRHRRGREGRLLPAPPGRDHRARRRIRLRQVGDGPHRHGAADQARHRSRRRPQITLDGKNILTCPTREMRKLRGNGISMIFQEPMSSLNPVYTIGQQIGEVIHVHNRISRKEAMERARDAARGSADPRARGAAQAISAPALRRPAPARDDRHGARQPSRRADRRRADHGARRHRAGADPQPDQGPARTSTAWR